MARYLFSVEVRKTKAYTEISLFKKTYQSPLFVFEYDKSPNNCESYTLAKALNPKAKHISYEIISCNCCYNKNNESFAHIKKSHNMKVKILRNIRNVKALKKGFKEQMRLLMMDLSRLKFKKLGDLKIYFSNNPKIETTFKKIYETLHKTR
jgi:hypothetical protein